MTDTQIKEEAFLEDVDGLLNAGEVPNLFPLDERAEIIEVLYVQISIIHYPYTSCVYHLKAVRPLAQAEYKDAEFTPLSLFNFFINRCRENLHIVLAMSPIGDAFRNRLRQFPSLINCCTIDWFQVSIEYR